MNLIINENKVIKNVSKNDISRYLRKLKAEEFAILEKSEQYFLQVMLDDKNNAVIEYRNGSENEHYQAKINDPSDVVKAFLLYLQGEELKGDFFWEKMKF